MTLYVDWNLELAHVNWGEEGAPASIQESVAQGWDWISGWRAEGLSHVVCCLIDDKEISIPERAVWLSRHKAVYPELFKIVDYVCFESDLISLKGEFLMRVDPLHRGKVEREFERYREKHGKVACSHDIAIWHALRLGLLPSGAALLNPLRTPVTRPFGRSILSILEEEDRAPEERAKEILRYVADAAVKRVSMEFYA